MTDYDSVQLEWQLNAIAAVIKRNTLSRHAARQKPGEASYKLLQESARLRKKELALCQALVLLCKGTSREKRVNMEKLLRVFQASCIHIGGPFFFISKFSLYLAVGLLIRMVSAWRECIKMSKTLGFPNSVHHRVKSSRDRFITNSTSRCHASLAFSFWK